jgi:hypothetical protein
MKHAGRYLGLTALVGVAACAHAEPSVSVTANPLQVGMGRVLTVRAEARLSNGAPAAGRLLLPYVNGKRWGSHEYADARGRATFLLPMPNVGPADVQVLFDGTVRPAEEWIWSERQSDAQAVRFERTFTLPDRPTGGTLHVVVDDSATIAVNGRKVAATAGWTRTCSVPAARLGLRRGNNTIVVDAYNHSGPAGLLVRLEWQAGTQRGLLASNRQWKTSESGRAVPCVSAGMADQGLWAPMMQDWPTVIPRARLMAGSPMPNRGVVSKPVRVQVVRRILQPIRRDPNHLVGIQWEPWFTPSNASWNTAQAVPVFGFYWSWDPNVTRQHMLWFAESGIDFLVADWTNHLWDRTSWNDRPEAANEIIHCTTLALETMAAMHDEGIPVPKMVLLLGLTNGPSTTMEAVNEEMEWVYHSYVRNPRFKDLFLDVDGKPLILIFNGGGPGWLLANGDPFVDESHFTVRWCSSQHQITRDNEHGYWSWMDGVPDLPVTLSEGRPEAMTPSVGFFGAGGWLGKEAYGRRNGWTLVETFQRAIQVKPRFLQIHQYQEFAGQPEGQGYGPNRDHYVDSYSPEFSDDVEPTSLTAPAYRGEGGWGFSTLNYMRALVDLYRQPKPETSVLAIGAPLRASPVTGPSLAVEWTLAGRPAQRFVITVSGKGTDGKSRTITRTAPPTARKITIDLSGLSQGPVTVRVRAAGTRCRYRPLWTEDALPLQHPIEAYAEVIVTYRVGTITQTRDRARTGK